MVDTPTELGLDCELRSVDQSGETIANAVRRIVHDHVSGWSITLNQSPQERRRKKRMWNRRSHQRHKLRRTVWVSEATWGRTVAGRRELLITPTEMECLTRDISLQGVGLLSDRAPRRRLVVLEFDTWTGPPLELLVRLHWRKRKQPYEYQCGGTILGVISGR